MEMIFYAIQCFALIYVICFTPQVICVTIRCMIHDKTMIIGVWHWLWAVSVFALYMLSLPVPYHGS